MLVAFEAPSSRVGREDIDMVEEAENISVKEELLLTGDLCRPFRLWMLMEQ